MAQLNHLQKKFIESIEKRASKKTLKNEEKNGALWIQCPTAQGDLPAFCKAASDEGALFDCAFAIACAKNEFKLIYIFASFALKKHVAFWALVNPKKINSTSALIPAAEWDERKIQDLTPIRFNGIANPATLLYHSNAKTANASSTAGTVENAANLKTRQEVHEIPKSHENEGFFEIPVGPVHAGIIEPGHFRFHVAGEDIERLDATLFYMHRGLEKLCEGKSFQDALALVEQISGDETIASTLAYALAVENLAGAKVSQKALVQRALLAELERICCHLADLGGMAVDVGFYAASSRYAYLREEQMRLSARICGNRFLRSMIAVGGMKKYIGQKEFAETVACLERLLKELSEAEKVTFSSSTFLDRAYSAGILRKKTAQTLCVVGPPARATGIACDLRVHIPYGAYEKIRVNEALASNGDVLSRFAVKLSELRESAKIAIKICSQQQNAGEEKNAAIAAKASGKALGLGFCESARGATTMIVESDGKGKISSLNCKTASFRNWPSLQKAVLGNIVPDFPLINKSFNLSYAGCDL